MRHQPRPFRIPSRNITRDTCARLFFLFLLLLQILIPSEFASASVLKHHVKPTLTDGFDKTGLILIGSGLLATALAQTKDYEVREAYQDNQRISHSSARFGDFLGTGIPGSAIALSQMLFASGDNKHAGYAHAEALIDTFIATSLLKTINRRNRPDSDNKQAMPSGHASTTFATATSLAYSYGWAAAVPAYMLAGFTAATRWSDDAHWFSDTVAGAFVGIFWGRATWLHHGCITPVVSRYGSGFVWKTSF
ncbi:MAG: phosphatase PAP2 family protein [Bdellovibrionales bacterium]